MRPPERLSPGAALLPLRLFLGVTFVYAGVQKLSDPGFLHKGAPTYIGTQLHGFANGTPGAFILRAFAIPHPVFAGVAVALTEIAVGLLVTAGLFTRTAALVGLALNLILFLTNSWHASPYFLGSDIVFVFAWLPVVLAGTAGQPALEHSIASRITRLRRLPSDPAAALVTRRTLLGRALLTTGAATVGIAGISYAAKGTYRGSRTAALRGEPARRTSRRGHRKSSHASSNLPTGAVRIGPANAVQPGHAALYRDPSDGQPDVIVRDSAGRLSALSAICTHAGCEVTYEGGQLVCPCHGSVFNATTGAVLQGPASQPLPSKRVIERSGEIYAIRS
jgi:thiosulfate dehydrogenase (quinone) large subunit